MSSLNDFLDSMQREQDSRSELHECGLQALHHLAEVVINGTGQSIIIGRFLLGLYDGSKYPFNLVSLRALDNDLHASCMAVLQLDYVPLKEVHEYLDNGPELFKRLCDRGGES